MNREAEGWVWENWHRARRPRCLLSRAKRAKNPRACQWPLCERGLAREAGRGTP